MEVIRVLPTAGVKLPRETVLLSVPSDAFVTDTAVGVDPVRVIVPVVCAKAVFAKSIATTNVKSHFIVLMSVT